MEKQKNVPQLRFPGFEDEWECRFLRSVADIYDGTHQTPKYVAEGIKFVSVENIAEIQNTDKFITAEAFEKDFKTKPQKDDILMTRITAGIIGATSIVSNNDPLGYYVSLALIRKRGTVDVNFLNQTINSEYFKHELHKRIIHVAFPKKINLGDIGDCTASFPTHPEQILIASFFTSIDRKLTQLKQKQILLEQYKKGIMQKLFSQELRFKDANGIAFPRWSNKKFRELYTFKTTNSFSRDNLNYENGEVKNIHYGDIHTKFKLKFDLSKEQVPFINPEISIKIAADNYCQIGDLVIADASEDYADVGKSIEIVNLSQQKTVAGLHTILARPDLTNLSVGFGGFLMKSSPIRNQIKIIAQGTKVLSISASRLAGIKVELPSKEEQAKISQFLSIIDEKTNYVQTQILKTEQYKKGMLQKMFC